MTPGPLEDPDPILFAHRGASAYAPPNSLAAFRLGIALGGTGVETDAWLSADGVPVLSHQCLMHVPGLRTWSRRQTAAELAGRGVPSMLDLYTAVGTGPALSIDLQHAAVARPVLRVARSVGALGRLHVCSGDLRLLADLRGEAGPARLVHTIRGLVREGVGARLRAVAAAGVDAVNLAWGSWDAALVGRVHDAGLLAFAWDAHAISSIERMLDVGVDAIYSDHPEHLVAAVRRRRAGSSIEPGYRGFGPTLPADGPGRREERPLAGNVAPEAAWIAR